MSEQREGAAHRGPIALDVLIVGGGVQGLWLLRDLRESGYSVALLERNAIGGAQTLHSHGFLHRGHSYPHVYGASAEHFVNAMTKWRTLLAHAPEAEAPQPTYVGFVALANALFWEKAWRTEGLRFERSPVPKPLHDNVVERVYKTEDQRQIKPGMLVKFLAREERPSILHGTLRSASPSDIAGNIESVYASIGAGAEIIAFRPRCLVLCAGAGNDRLVERLGLAHAFPERPITRIRRSPMFVFTSPTRLPRISLLIPDLWLFVVSQPTPDGGTAWLVSSGIDPPEGVQTPSLSEAAEIVRNKFRFLMPDIFDTADEVSFGGYVGLKAEAMPADQEPPPIAPQVRSFPGSNTLLVWPTKLTFAPLAGDVVRNWLRERGLGPSFPSGPVLPQDLTSGTLTIGVEKWASLRLRPWKDFIEESTATSAVFLDPEQGPESVVYAGEDDDVLRKSRRGSQPRREVSVVQQLLPPAHRALRVFFHCESAQVLNPEREIPISGGESGASLVRSAFRRLGYADVHPQNARDLNEESWSEERTNNLVLLDSPIVRQRDGYALTPHNKWAYEVLKQLDVRKVTPSIRIDILTESDQALNPKESLKLVLNSVGVVKVADALWDYGLVARFPNPFDRSTTVLLLAGLHAPATHAAAVAVTDPGQATRLFDYLHRVEVNPTSFVAAFRVKRSYFEEHLRDPEWLRAEVITSPFDPMEIFMSYAVEDSEWAEWLIEVLGRRGYRLVNMGTDFPPAGNFVKNIEEAIRIGRMISIWSKSYKVSPWCQREYDAALAKFDKVLVVKIDDEDMMALSAPNLYLRMHERRSGDAARLAESVNRWLDGVR